MSIVNAVLLDGSRMPSPKAWAAEIRRLGFDMRLDPDFDVETFSGFLPCAYEGQEAGFEYFREPIAEAGLEDDARKQAGDRDTLVSLRTQGDMRGLMTAVIASTVLASLTGGVHWDQEANEFHAASEAVAWGKEMEGSVRAELTTPPIRASAPAVPRPAPADVRIRAHVRFRGANLLMLETIETPARRFTIQMSTLDLPAASEVEITGLWEQSAGPAIVRTLVIGGVVRELDEKGAATTGPDVGALIRSLGNSDAAVRGLIAAGEAAVPALVALALDARAATANRHHAVVILGQIGQGARAAVGPLARLANDATLGPAARRSVELIERTP